MQRNQKLPIVNEIEVKNVENKAFAYGDKNDENAFYVQVNWSYTDELFSDYQTNAELVFIHDDIKLSLVQVD